MMEFKVLRISCVMKSSRLLFSDGLVVSAYWTPP